MHGRDVKNREALANPEALDQFRTGVELNRQRTHNDNNAVILSACRTPIGSFGGALKDLSAADLGAIVIREAIARAGIDAADIGDVIMGCVLQAGAGMNVARQAAIKAGVPVEVPAETVNRVCGSGLQAVVHAVEAVKAGYVDLIVAGGTESMSNAPYIMNGARWGYRMGNAELVDSMLAEGLTCAIKGCHMGNTAEEIVKRFDVSRADQDAFAAESQRRAEQAHQRPACSTSEIVAGRDPAEEGRPRSGWTQDEYPRAGTTAEKLAALKPAFAKDGTVTAGNCVRHQRRRRGAGRLDRGDEPKRSAGRRWRGSCRTARPASIR